jgi:tRNA A-37 threonylcarbamoyl transferase component Bud32
MEYERARGVSERGLPTYLPLALGEQESRFGPGESILITRSLENTQEFHLFAVNILARLPAARQARLRQHLARELGGLVARMHDAGTLHNDLHPANILVRLEENDRLSLFLVDLSAVRLGTALSWKESRQNLVILNRWFVLRASRSDRYRFWKSYCDQRQLSRLDDRSGARQERNRADEVECHTLTSNLSFWKRRDRRCLRNNRYYRRVSSPGVVGHVVADLDAQLLSKLRTDPDEPFRAPGVRFLKDSPSSTVIELDVVIDGRPRSLIYKRFRVTSWLDAWSTLFRRAPALRSWIHGQGFRERGLPTARPLAILQRRGHGLHREGYLLTEKIGNAQDLHEFVMNRAGLPASRHMLALRRQIAQVATVIRELHRRRLSHRDLKAANILVSRDDSTFCSPFSSRAWTTGCHGLLPIFATSVWLIDLVGVRRYRWLARARQTQNLARLNASFPAGGPVTRTDRLRFLRTYLQWNLHGKANWKAWWLAIDQATREKIHRNHKRGRPLF